MITWNEDLEDMPRDNSEQILVALEGVKTFKVTYFIWEDYQKRGGRWFGMRPNETIKAWSRLNYPIQEKAASDVAPETMLPTGVTSPQIPVAPPAALPSGVSLPPDVEKLL